MSIRKARQLGEDVQDALKCEDEHEEGGGKEGGEETDEDFQEGHRMICLQFMTDDGIDIVLHRQIQHDTGHQHARHPLHYEPQANPVRPGESW